MTSSMHGSHLFLLALSVLSISITVAHANHCHYQKFRHKEAYKGCSDLPLLNAYLHYTFDDKNSTLSIAYIAKPEKPEGWVAWGINPVLQTSGMIGTQALLAFKDKGAVVVKTYDVASNITILESKLSFDVWDLAAEQNDLGQFIIYAKLNPPNNATRFLHVWQVGARVSNGVPMRHSLNIEHRSSVGPMDVSKTTGPENVPSAAEGNGHRMTKKLCFLFLLPFFIASMVA